MSSIDYWGLLQTFEAAYVVLLLIAILRELRK